MYVNEMNPYDEAQHILEVLQRNTSTRNVKMISVDEATIQIEQRTEINARIVLEELEYRGYKIVSDLIPVSGGGWTAGIRKEERSRRIKEEPEGFEPGD